MASLLQRNKVSQNTSYLPAGRTRIREAIFPFPMYVGRGWVGKGKKNRRKTDWYATEKAR